MKYKERDELVSGLRELADFFEAKGLELPVPYQTTVYVRVSKYGENGFDDEATKAEMVKIARAMKPCKKEYDSSDLNLVRDFGRLLRLMYYTKREAVCEKVQVGTKEVEKVVYPEPIKTGIMVEEPVYEWQCDPLLS